MITRFKLYENYELTENIFNAFQDNETDEYIVSNNTKKYKI